MKKIVLLIAFFLVIVSCYGAIGIDGIQSSDPIKQGCGYIAAAIVTHGILSLFRIFFRS
jgi:hypothetical protein